VWSKGATAEYLKGFSAFLNRYPRNKLSSLRNIALGRSSLRDALARCHRPRRWDGNVRKRLSAYATSRAAGAIQP